MKWLLWIGLSVVLILVLVVVFMLKGPNVSKYEFLKEPRIVNKPDAYVIEVPFEGASEGLGKAFGILMRTYFKTPGVPKGPGMSAPAARYENMIDLNLPAEERAKAKANVVWKGSAAIIIPTSVTTLPTIKTESNLMPRLATWKYGDVAEILHIGPYENEVATIRKLTDYIQSQGYVINGLHEEEYLRGPGMLLVKPKDYYTIIRYPVKKVEQK